MSYIMPSPRGFDHSQQPVVHSNDAPLHNNQPSRLNMSSPAPYDDYNTPQSNNYPASPLSPSSHHNGPHPPLHPQTTSQDLPKVGQTRCYWVLLTSELHFIYMDPVLQSHLEEQAEALVGKSLMSFVHPEEQASAKHDLGSALENRTLHGSVTRVRFSRLSCIRRQLGYQGPLPTWPDASKIAVDDNYMAVDLVINWAAEGLLLCFIHAVVDLTPHDNDEQNKTGWTNWCGTPSMGTDQIQTLWQRLLMCIPQGDFSKVFQILSGQEHRVLLLSWPPDVEGRPGLSGREFAKLVDNVGVEPKSHLTDDAKTSCTRRYKGEQVMASGRRLVESFCIVHGTIIFACHKVGTGTSRNSAGSTSASIQQLGYNAGHYNSGPAAQPYYDASNQYVLPPLAASPPYSAYSPQQSHHLVPANYSPQHWSQANEPPASQQGYSQWSSPNQPHSLSTSVSNVRSGSYPPAQPPSQPQWPSGGPNSAYAESEPGIPHHFNRSMSPHYGYAEAGEGGPPPPSPDVVPPPRRRVSPGATRDQYGPGGRSAGNRPVGVLRCSSCKATQSPEWRKGPTGKKELCNACGLRYARSRAKKEGHAMTAQRRRKEKNLSKAHSSTPPASSLRRSYDESSIVSTSDVGSNSGSPGYTGPHHAYEGLTPSPSPPAGNMNFVHYSHSHHAHPNSHPGASSSFYSVPSPLSNPPVLNTQHGSNNHHHHQHHHHDNQPSPASSRMADNVAGPEHVFPYSDNRSPLVSSPITHSPLTKTMPPASFERDRDRDRQLPPSSSSVRSILLAE